MLLGGKWTIETSQWNQGCSCSAAAWELLGCRPELHAQGWGNSLLTGVVLGGLGCFSENEVSPDILVVLKVVPFAGGRKGLAAQNAAGVLTSWPQ